MTQTVERESREIQEIASHLKEVIYRYFINTDLTPEQVIATQTTYQDEESAAVYSQIEWEEKNYTENGHSNHGDEKKDAITHIWQVVFQPFIKEKLLTLKEKGKEKKAHVVVAGCGSIRDLLIVAMVNKDVKVTGFDLSAALLTEAKQKINWKIIASIAEKLEQVEPNLNGWIGGVIKILKELNENIVPEPSGDIPDDMTQPVVTRISDRIKLLPPLDFLDLPTTDNPDLEKNSADLIMADASLPHIPKADLPQVLLELISYLKSDGMFWFNLRVDPEWSNREKGRVFADNELQKQVSAENDEKGWRFYTTYTSTELWELMSSLGNVEIITNESLKITTPQGETLVVEFKGITQHRKINKPAFFNIVITKQ